MNQMEANESIDDLLGTLLGPLTAMAVLGCLLSGLAVAAEVCLVSMRGTQPWGWSPAPRSLRRIAFATFGLSLAVLPATPATADNGRSAPFTTDCRARCQGVAGLQLPDLPTSASEIVVSPGSCLWTIAVHRLGSRATSADVAEFVDRLYRINRMRIGPDPD